MVSLLWVYPSYIWW